MDTKSFKKLFNKKLKEWNKNNQKEQWYLVMEILNWGSNLTLDNEIKFWEIIKNQIKLKAEKIDVTSELIIEYLFESKNSKKWMARFK